MGIFLVIFILFPHCFSCSARISPANRAKIVEDYVLSAKFDTKPDLPQLKIDYSKGNSGKVLPDEKFGSLLQKKDTSVIISPHKKYSTEEDEPGDPEAYNALEDRDFMIHYHVPPPLPPHPPLPHPHPPLPHGPAGHLPLPHPHPPLLHGPAGHLPLAIAFPPFFAVGFIAFLILLNSIQTTLLLTTKTKGLKPLGRCRRFAFAISTTPTAKRKYLSS